MTPSSPQNCGEVTASGALKIKIAAAAANSTAVLVERFPNRVKGLNPTTSPFEHEAGVGRIAVAFADRVHERRLLNAEQGFRIDAMKLVSCG